MEAANLNQTLISEGSLKQSDRSSIKTKSGDLTTQTDEEFFIGDKLQPTFKQCLKSKMFTIIFLMSSMSIRKSIWVFLHFKFSATTRLMCTKFLQIQNLP
jgi:hypothetical protein